MLVRIDEDTAIEMLMDRVHFWTDDDDDIVCELYHKMYENYIYSGFFDGEEFDIMEIVDNDYVNFCYELNHGYSTIEAEYRGSFLCRF